MVFPAPSKPRIRILISLEPNKDENKFEKNPPEEQKIKLLQLNVSLKTRFRQTLQIKIHTYVHKTNK